MTIAERTGTYSPPPKDGGVRENAGKIGFGWAFFEVCSVGLMVGLSAVLLVVFLAAYLDPGKEVLLMIDAYHEANVEVVVLPLWFVCGVVTLVRMVRRTRQIRQAADEESGRPGMGD